MALNATTTLPYTPAEVVATFADRAFVEHLGTQVGGTLKDFTVSGDLAGAFESVTVRSVPTDRLPEIARKFVGASVDVTQREAWSAPAADGSREANVTVEVSGIPVNVSAVQRVAAAAGGSRVDLEGEVSSGIPFLGGKIASAAEPFVGKALNLQAAQAKAWLERQA
ncbi:DUF2505 domain-containing protein [Arthrobacter ginkgonis]|uniref:DUF2505 domain-containing protein n=1 Tax=Arthrobacter ginkgonis TaxID=1630594 RepID=A0ABP7CRK7_9MICC